MELNPKYLEIEQHASMYSTDREMSQETLESIFH